MIMIGTCKEKNVRIGFLVDNRSTNLALQRIDIHIHTIHTIHVAHSVSKFTYFKTEEAL